MRYVAGFTAAALLLAFLHPAGAITFSPAESAQPDQKATTGLRRHPTKMFAVLKSSFADDPVMFFYIGEGNDYWEEGDPVEGRAVALGSCAGPENIGFETTDEFSAALGRAAFQSLVMENALKPFPKTLWKQDIAKWEATRLEEIRRENGIEPLDWNYASKTDKAMRVALAKKLNKFRAANPSMNLPKVYPAASECGDGGVVVLIETTPKARRVQYLNRHFQNICIAQNIPPEETARCNYWRDASGAGDELSGRYLVLVTWPDGSTTDRNLDVDSLTEIDTGRIFRIAK